jgi:hypothetical protein
MTDVKFARDETGDVIQTHYLSVTLIGGETPNLILFTLTA